MLDQQNAKDVEVTASEESDDFVDVEMTQKIELNLDNQQDLTDTVHNILSNEINIVDLFKKKSLFFKKVSPDDYVKSGSRGSVISSIATLENDSKLQDLNNTYEVKQKLAEGGHGIVRSAFDKILRRDVIVKSAKSFDEEKGVLKDQNLFVSEARIMAKLDHPAIAPIYGMYSDSQNKLHLTMKHIQGKTLKEYLRDISVLYQHDGVEKYNEMSSILNRIGYLIRVCEAVEYAHCKGVIHRDLKPENIIIGSFGEVYVMDWGIACLFAPDESPDSKHMTEIGLHFRCELAGTPCYIAPELIRGGLSSPQSDIFSLGMILFEIVTLTRSVPGNTINEVFKNILGGNLKPYKHHFLKNRLSDDLKAIIAKATTPDMLKRYETAGDMAKDLKNYLIHNETIARPYNFSRRCLRWISHHLMFSFSMILILSLCLAVITLYGLHVQNIFINKQKTKESMLAYFQHEAVKRSTKLNYTVSYIENQLTNLSHHVKSIFNISDRNHVDVTTSLLKTDHFKKANSSLLEKKTAAVTTMIKHMFDISNLKLKKQSGSNAELAIIEISLALDNGSILFYHGDKKDAKKCCLKKYFSYETTQKKNADIIWSKPFKCIKCSKIIMCCSKRIWDKDNKSEGVIAVGVDLEYIYKCFFSKESPGMRRFLMNKKGEILISGTFKYENMKISPETNELYLNKFIFSKEFQRAVRHQRLQFRGRLHNTEYIFAINYVPSLNYYYVEQMSKRKLVKDYTKHLVL